MKKSVCHEIKPMTNINNLEFIQFPPWLLV